MTRLFGTDGVRGVAGEELTEELAYALGRAAVRVLGPRVVIGRDSRLSGPMLEGALVAGICAEGGEPDLAGIIPTPAVALFAVQGDYDCGIVISASHNPPEYNGIKFFGGNGFKLPDEVEDQLQAVVEEVIGQPVPAVEVNATVLEDAVERYVENAVKPLMDEGISLEGMTIALDCGNGASCVTTPAALRLLGADVQTIYTDFNGARINVDCGSTHLDPVIRTMKMCGADIALAHDGDADRLLAVAPDGTVCDGDYILSIIGKDMKAAGTLAENTVVCTVMANLGFMQAMEREGIDLITSKVGDRYVLEDMLASGAVLGGEQSGHVIFLDRNTTGDGLVTALELLRVIARTGKPLLELMKVMEKFPQSLVNVRVRDKALYAKDPEIAAAEIVAKTELGSAGRLLVRASGTEPLIRVMVEASTQEQADRVANAVADVVRERIGA